MRIDSRILDNMAEWMDKREEIPNGWIYLGDETERYILGQPGNRNMLVFGVNPSTATPGDNNIDPTVRKVRKLTAEDGYDGWIMVNLYPLRATDPRELPQKEDKKLLEKNLKVLKALVKAYRIDAVWAAWGNTIDTRFYLGDTLYNIQEELEGDFQWYYRGAMTKDGNPRHPLYMKSGENYEWFPAGDYAANWRYADAIL
jgi:hypothetical protein